MLEITSGENYIVKLKIRLSIIVIGIFLVLFAGISTIILLRARDLQTAAAIESATNLAKYHSMEAAREFEVYLDASRTVAQILDSFYTIDAPNRREYYNNILFSLLESNENFLGIFTSWFPNALDGMDAYYANTPGTDASGRYISYFYYEAGEIKMRAYADYESVLANPQKERILEPWLHNVSGRNVMVTTVISPIVSGDNVVGVVGINVNISSTQDMVDAIRSNDNGVAAVFSNGGTVAAHFEPSRNGRPMRLSEQNLMGDRVDEVADHVAIGKPYNFEIHMDALNTDMQIIMEPFTVGKTDTPWAFIVGIPMNKVVAPVRELTIFTIIISSVAIVIAGIIIFFVALGVTRPLVQTSDMLKDISEGEGDLTKQLSISSKDEIGDMSHYFNLTLQKIRNLIVVIKDQSVSLSDIGAELSSNMTETAAAINEITANVQAIKGQVVNQSASVTETNSTMAQITENIEKLNEQIENQSASVAQSSSAVEEMLANIKSVTQTLIMNTENVKDLANASETGRTGLEEVSIDIQEIAKESEGLLEITAVMENIASQTNLLSMNAAIEAAHAGDSGKGFAVVADEIRKLAESSGEQSKTIAVVLKKIKDSIDKITHSTDAVLTKFEAIDTGVRTVYEQEENIRNAMEEQNTGSQQILEAIGQLNEITQIVKSSSDEMLIGSREVIKESQNLGMISQEISNGINETASGADQINTAVTRVNEISGENKERIDALVSEVSRFKVE